MTTGTILLIAISIVVVTDLLIAIYFRNLAERTQSGERVSSNIDPDGARRLSTLMFLTAPVLWLVVALICFGVIPTGIDTVKF